MATIPVATSTFPGTLVRHWQCNIPQFPHQGELQISNSDMVHTRARAARDDALQNDYIKGQPPSFFGEKVPQPSTAGKAELEKEVEITVNEHLRRAQDFLSKEGVDIDRETYSQFERIDHFLRNLSDQKVRCNRKLYEDVKVMVKIQLDRIARKKTGMLIPVRQPSFAMSSRRLPTRNPMQRAITALALMKEDHPPFTTENSTDDVKFRTAITANDKEGEALRAVQIAAYFDGLTNPQGAVEIASGNSFKERAMRRGRQAAALQIALQSFATNHEQHYGDFLQHRVIDIPVDFPTDPEEPLSEYTGLRSEHQHKEENIDYVQAENGDNVPRRPNFEVWSFVRDAPRWNKNKNYFSLQFWSGYNKDNQGLRDESDEGALQLLGMVPGKDRIHLDNDLNTADIDAYIALEERMAKDGSNQHLGSESEDGWEYNFEPVDKAHGAHSPKTTGRIIKGKWNPLRYHPYRSAVAQGKLTPAQHAVKAGSSHLDINMTHMQTSRESSAEPSRWRYRQPRVSTPSLKGRMQMKRPKTRPAGQNIEFRDRWGAQTGWGERPLGSPMSPEIMLANPAPAQTMELEPHFSDSSLPTKEECSQNWRKLADAAWGGGHLGSLMRPDTVKHDQQELGGHEGPVEEAQAIENAGKPAIGGLPLGSLMPPEIVKFEPFGHFSSQAGLQSVEKDVPGGVLSQEPLSQKNLATVPSEVQKEDEEMDAAWAEKINAEGGEIVPRIPQGNHSYRVNKRGNSRGAKDFWEMSKRGVSSLFETKWSKEKSSDDT